MTKPIVAAEEWTPRGVRVDPRDSSEEIVRLLEEVEAFEQAVEQRGGDLMVDEPVSAHGRVVPDDAAFVLPARRDGESGSAYAGRITDARARASHARRHP